MQYTDLDDVDVIPELIELGRTIDLNETIKFVQSHFSSTPTASDAFAQAAVRYLLFSSGVCVMCFKTVRVKTACFDMFCPLCPRLSRRRHG